MIPRSSGLRVLLLHNTDFSNLPPEDPAYSSGADVEIAARGVAGALARRGHHPVVDGLDCAGIGRLIRLLSDDPPDVVFNLCESLRTDARHEVVLPALLDLMGVPYTGSGPVALGIALRKDRAKALLRDSGVPTPDAVTLTSVAGECGLPFPLIVKPTREDASVGISSASVVHDRAALDAAVAHVVHALHQPALVERFIEGRELYVSLLGNDPPSALPMHEIDFTDLPAGLPRIVSYSGKWDPTSPEFLGTRPTRCFLSDAVRLRVERAAQSAFKALDLADYGRVDVRLAADDTPYVIDVNPNCDLTDGAGFSRAGGYSGLSYEQLVERICLVALERHRNAQPHRTAAPPAALVDAAALALDSAPPARRSRVAARSDHEGRVVPAGRGPVRARADRRRAR
ncbi:MAG: ATP-grasp domain-containing protein [Myxococcales bacterium]|nr:ATP-grasp domain-containing protein [Myxococcales bacterium]